jgi:hypothetical protein
MRRKYILRASDTDNEYAWVIGVYFDRGTMTIGGPRAFVDAVDRVLEEYFGIDSGIEGHGVVARDEDMKRKRLVFDVHPVTLRAFLRGIRRMSRRGIAASKVRNMGRLLR